MWHGIFQDASSWIFNLNPDVSAPALMAAKAGLDVWLGNARGTLYSSYPKDDKYKNIFSFAEIGTFDVPAVIKFVKQQTQAEKLQYVGYSQGTTQMFYGMAS